MLKHTKREIDREIRANLRAIDLAIESGTADFMKLVDRLRRSIILSIVETGSVDATTSSMIKSNVRSIMATYEEKFRDMLTTNQQRLFVKGLRVIDKTVSEASKISNSDQRLALPYLSEQKLAILQIYSAELIKGLTEYARGKIATEIDLAVLGEKSTIDIIKAIGRNLKSKSIFSSIAKRAEVIHRTEVNRIQTIALSDRLKQASPQIPDLKKQWIHAYVGVPRPGHLALDGVVVEADEKFKLEGADGKTYYVDGPFDPVLPAGETINCRCAVAPLVGRFETPQSTL